MENTITLVLSKAEVELVQDAMSIGETQLSHTELGKILSIDVKILREKIWEQTKPQIKK